MGGILIILRVADSLIQARAIHRIVLVSSMEFPNLQSISFPVSTAPSTVLLHVMLVVVG
jgi:hypothetical protein